MVSAIKKGKAGEAEFCKWLDKNFDLPSTPRRNLDQTRDGGTDVIVPPFAFEVKRRETLDKLSWWIQVKYDAEALGLEPVVAYRQNRQPWSFLISASHIGCGLGFIELDERTFRLWAEGVWSAETNNNQQ